MKPYILLIATSLLALMVNSSTAFGQEETVGRDLKSFVLAEGSYTRALGNLSPTFPSATGGYLGYGRYFPEHVVGIAKIGYSNYRVSDDAQGEQKLSIVELIGGPRYYFVTEDFMPFIFLNVGMNFVTEIINQPDFSSDRTSVQFAWQAGFGSTVPIVGPLGVDLEVMYNSHFLYHEGSTNGVEGRGNLTGFQYGLGLTWAVE